MPRFETTRSVKHSAETMFNLVADVEKYPQFVPMCESLIIRRRVEEAAGSTTLIADMAIGYKMIREVFTTRVRLDPGAGEETEAGPSRILVSYIDGPFRHLENRWTFIPTGEKSCDIRFFIDYEFKSRTFQLLAGAVFEQVFRRMAEAFEARADALANRA